MTCMRSATTTAMVAFALTLALSTGCADVGGELPHDLPTTVGATISQDVIRYWDGVGFTDAQSQAVLDYVNDATFSQLDDDVGLDRRAVKAIVAARPLKSMNHLSHLFFVGFEALTKLKDAATTKLFATAV